MTSIIATLPALGILVLALSTLGAEDNPLRSFRDFLPFLGGLARTFIWVMGYIGLPMIVGSAVAKPRPEPSSEQDADRKPDHVPS